MYLTPVKNYQAQYTPQFKGKKKEPVRTEKLYDEYDGKSEFKKNLKIAATTLGISLLGNAGNYIYKTYDSVLEETQDINYVTPSQRNFSNRQEALDYAFKKISAQLNTNAPKEYSVIINDSTNKILSEAIGDSVSVKNRSISTEFYEKLGIKTDTYTSLHGHPEQYGLYTPPFSFQDFTSFAYDKHESSTFVVTKDGEYFHLKKKNDFKPLDKKNLASLRKEYDKVLENLEDFTITGVSCKNPKKRVMDFPLMHEFWLKTAEKYNLEYETNYMGDGKLRNLGWAKLN